MTERRRVAHPRSLAHRVGPRRTVALELVEQTPVGEELLATFLRQHLRLNALLVAVVGGLISSTLVLFIAAPTLASERIGGMPLTWIMLGVLSYPTFAIVGWQYRKRADQIDDHFANQVRQQ
jgi:putative solute:sodium symporter small subunit